jgi:excisionase family DNA binding protein
VTSSLVRPSELARALGKSQETVVLWIQRGKLPALRSPGGHWRLRPADVRAFCEREGLPLPDLPSLSEPRVVTGGLGSARVLRAPGVTVEAYDDPYDALVAAIAGRCSLLVLPAAAPGFDTAAAVAAVRRGKATRSLPVAIVGVTARRADVLRAAGATYVLGKRDDAGLARLLRSKSAP